METIQGRRDECARHEQIHPWRISRDNFLLLPKILPSLPETVDYYKELIDGLELGQGIKQYLDVHGKDIHLLEPVLKLRNAVEDQGFNPSQDRTTAQGLKPYFLVVFGTGDGQTLKRLIDHFKPQHLFVALADWHDLATSFWTIDWGRLCHEQENVRGGKLTLGCYEDGRGVLNALKDECLPGLDHAMVYLPPDGACSSKAIKLRKEINEVELNHAVTYLGYTCDEHNMVWNSWNSLAASLGFTELPQQPLKGRMVICGVDHLDDNIEQLRVLQNAFYYCGSNFRTLKSKGVRVDFLALVERADVVYEDIKSVVQEYGSGETRLILSSSCHHQLQELFVDSMVTSGPR